MSAAEDHSLEHKIQEKAPPSAEGERRIWPSCAEVWEPANWWFWHIYEQNCSSPEDPSCKCSGV